MARPQVITERDGEKLAAAVDRLRETAGDDPTAAAAALAKSARLLPGELELVCHAYNTGRQVGQMRTAKTASAKFAPFPLADPAAAARLAWGTVPPKAAARYDPLCVDAGDWLAPQRPPLAKAAAAEPLPPDDAGPFPGRQARFAAAKQALVEDLAAQERFEAEFALRKLAAEASAHFARLPEDREPFGRFKAACETYGGELGAGLAEAVEARRPWLASERDARGAVDWGRPPYTVLARWKSACDRALAARKASPDPEPPAPPPPAGPTLLAKRANIFMSPVLAIAGGQLIGHGLTQLDTEKDRGVERAMGQLADPAHQNEMRQIRAQVMLNGMLSDPDDPLSGHDPERVVEAYNEIAQSAPRTAEHPAILGPLVRRRVMGPTEPFEAKELAETEKTLSQTGRPQQEAPRAPQPF